MADSTSGDFLQAKVSALQERFPEHPHQALAIVSIANQQLYLYRDGEFIKTYAVSTSRYGAGNRDGSYATPLGVHRIIEKIGGEAPPGTIFKGRENTYQVAQIVTDPFKTADDHITTRILWLDGLEPGINRGAGIDTYARYIYIHGTHEEGLIGQPVSYGCVRMTNHDVIELYEQLREDDLVWIVE